MRVLLVEDNLLLVEGLQLSLAKEGIQVDHLSSYKQAMVALDNEDFSAIILDLGLPDGQGADLIKYWRKSGVSLPIIVLTANTDFDTRLNCLDIGADDYLSKPFDVRELIARLRAIIRRQHGLDNNQFSYGALNIDFARCEVHFKHQLINLSRREYQLLLEFAQSAGRVLTRNQLEQLTYGWDEVGSNSIEVHIHHLRKKMATELIKTVRGIGYILAEVN